MKKKVILVAFLLLTILALPLSIANAERVSWDVPESKIFHVNLWGQYYGFPLVREVPSGNWVDSFARWATKTDEQLEDFMDSVQIEITLDGENLAFDAFFSTFPIGTFEAPTVTFRALHRPLPPGSYVVAVRMEFVQDHYDGWKDYPAGTILEADRVLVVTPKEAYPSYPDTPDPD